MSFLFDPLTVLGLKVHGETGRYPVNRIFCVGRNYAKHAAEMGVEVDREKPFYFTKSPSTATASGSSVPYPQGTTNYHFEMELVVALGAEVFNGDKEAAWDAVFGYCSGLDMTRRDLQLSERAKQRPWSLGKDVEGSCILAPITRAADFGRPGGQAIKLTQNGETRQDATLEELIWKVDEIIAHLSGFYRLQPGDLIMTGTAAGVGPVEPGDAIKGWVDGLDPVELTIGAAEAS